MAISYPPLNVLCQNYKTMPYFCVFVQLIFTQSASSGAEAGICGEPAPPIRIYKCALTGRAFGLSSDVFFLVSFVTIFDVG